MAAVLSCRVQPDRWIAPHLAVRTLFDCDRWSCRVNQPVRFSPLWPASLERFWSVVVWHLWIGRASHPGPSSSHRLFGPEVFNVGGWLTHCDFALEAAVDFLAVVEHRLIPARAPSECNRLRGKGLSSIWAPACQDSSHVGNAGVGVVSLRGAPGALPSFATSQFEEFLALVERFATCCLLVLVVSCICLFFMVIRVLILMLNSLL